MIFDAIRFDQFDYRGIKSTLDKTYIRIKVIQHLRFLNIIERTMRTIHICDT